jgi:hypothetical protein
MTDRKKQSLKRHLREEYPIKSEKQLGVRNSEPDAVFIKQQGKNVWWHHIDGEDRVHTK